jgi:type I pantothenate kinase
VSFVETVRAGRPATIPVYSHHTCDITGEIDDIAPADVVIVEGIVVLNDAVAGLLDRGVYVEAAEADVRSWFVERFARLAAAGRTDESSFYHLFAALDDDTVRNVAEATWDGINGVNLREHIDPSKRHAHLVIRKAGDHSILGVERGPVVG